MNLTLSNILNASETGVRHLKSLSDPIGVAKTICGLGSHLSFTADLSQKVLKRLNWAEGPPEVAALMADSLAVGHLLWEKPVTLTAARISELAIAILKRCCDIVKWLEQRHLLVVESSLLGRLEGIGSLCDVMSSSLDLWQNVYAKPSSERQLLISICRVFKSYFLFYVYLSDNKEVKLVANGLGVIADGYALAQRIQKISYKPKEWNIALPSFGQVIILTAVASLAIYIIEKKVDSEILH